MSPPLALRLSQDLRLAIGSNAVDLAPRQAFHLGESLIRLATLCVVKEAASGTSRKMTVTTKRKMS